MKNESYSMVDFQWNFDVRIAASCLYTFKFKNVKGPGYFDNKARIIIKSRTNQNEYQNKI